jgi:hypothetical protein
VLPVSQLGLSQAGDQSVMTGKYLLDNGLKFKLGRSPKAVWITYQNFGKRE